MDYLTYLCLIAIVLFIYKVVKPICSEESYEDKSDFGK